MNLESLIIGLVFGFILGGVYVLTLVYFTDRKIDREFEKTAEDIRKDMNDNWMSRGDS